MVSHLDNPELTRKRPRLESRKHALTLTQKYSGMLKIIANDWLWLI